MAIVPQSPLFLSTSWPAVPLLAAPPKRLALPAPKIVGYLSAKAGGYMDSPLQRPDAVASGVSIALPHQQKPEKRAVSATVVNPLRLIDDPRERWAAFERIYGRDRSREEMDAELDAIVPGYTAYMRTKMQQINQRLSEMKAMKEMEVAS